MAYRVGWTQWLQIACDVVICPWWLWLLPNKRSLDTWLELANILKRQQIDISITIVGSSAIELDIFVYHSKIDQAIFAKATLF